MKIIDGDLDSENTKYLLLMKKILLFEYKWLKI